MSKPTALSALLPTALLSLAATAQSVSGIVYDPGDSNNGIGGVSVTIRDSKGSVVGSGLTDGKGTYKVQLSEAPVTGLIAYYQKVHYFAYPTPRKIETLQGPQPAVPLSKASAGAEYYRVVARRVARASGDDTRLIMSSLASLPDTDRLSVAEQLSANAPEALPQFREAELTSRYSIEVSKKLEAGQNKDFEFIKAYPNSSKAGSIWLIGSASDPKHVKAARDTALSVDGVTHLKTDLAIYKKAHVPE